MRDIAIRNNDTGKKSVCAAAAFAFDPNDRNQQRMAGIDSQITLIAGMTMKMSSRTAGTFEFIKI